MGLPLGAPAIAAFQPSHYAELRKLMPSYALFAAPARDRLVAAKGDAVAGFLVGIDAGEGRQSEQPAQYGGDFAADDVKLPALSLQFLIQFEQALPQELVVLIRCVRLCPHAGSTT